MQYCPRFKSIQPILLHFISQTILSVPEGKQGSPGQLGSSVESSSATSVSAGPGKKQQIPAPKWAQVSFYFIRTSLAILDTTYHN